MNSDLDIGALASKAQKDRKTSSSFPKWSDDLLSKTCVHPQCTAKAYTNMTLRLTIMTIATSRDSRQWSSLKIP